MALPFGRGYDLPYAGTRLCQFGRRAMIFTLSRTSADALEVAEHPAKVPNASSMNKITHDLDTFIAPFDLPGRFQR